MQYSNQFAFGGWSWIVLSYRVQRKVITSDLGRSYLLLTRASVMVFGPEHIRILWEKMHVTYKYNNSHITDEG